MIRALSPEERRRLWYEWPFWARDSQLAPDGLWRIWLVLAGRGFGKTRCGVEWVREQVESKRMGRIALVGATASDVRDVLVEGESGILAKSPPWFRPRWISARSRLEWPNGAMAFTYSAEEPDRLRGKQHDGGLCDELACLVAGTAVETDRGPKPIESVQPGDRVLTRDGFRRVARAERTGDSETIYRLETESGRVLRGTWNHRVWTEEKGFVFLADLRPGATLLSCRSSSSGVVVAGTATRETATTETAPASFFTAPSGSESTGQSLTGGRCTTRTRTGRTTISPTSKRCLRASISSSTSRAGGSVGPSSSAGTTPSRHGSAGNRSACGASNVAACSSRPGCDLGSARTTARRHTEGTPASTTSLAHACTAATPSSSTSTAPCALARDVVRSVHVEPQTAAVYDLGVCDVHEYFANGLLVHNSWRYVETWDQLMFGMRLGADPRVVITTTPRPTDLIRSLMKRSEDPTDVRVTRGSSFDNKTNLAPAFLDQIVRRYEGTRLGRQEINAEILDDNPGALWRRADIDRHRVQRKDVPALVRVVVAVDPAVTSTEDSAETGIIVAGIGADGHGYVLDDRSLSDTPHRWAQEAVNWYHASNADRLVAEVNNGGDLVESAIRTVDRNVSYKSVRASRGKQTRAEPISSLYEQGRVHHVGVLAKLEDQLCGWDPTSNARSPDRLDALVWALTELMLEGSDDDGEIFIGRGSRR